MIIGLIVVSIYGVISPYKIYFFLFIIMFGAYTLYRYIIYKAEEDSKR